MGITYPPNPTQYAKPPKEWSKYSEDEKHFAFYTLLHGELQEMNRKLVGMTHVVDEWASDPQGDDLTIAPGSSSVFKPIPSWHADIVVTSIMAVWPTTSTSAVLQLGNRTITLPATLGFFNANGLRIQLEKADDRIFTIAPAGAGFIQLSGYADFARAGLRGTQRG